MAETPIKAINVSQLQRLYVYDDGTAAEYRGGFPAWRNNNPGNVKSLVAAMHKYEGFKAGDIIEVDNAIDYVANNAPWALRGVSASLEGATSSSTPTIPVVKDPYDFGNSLLQKGDKGTTVENIQNALQTLGYYNDTVDGAFGTNTKTAIEAYQRDHGLTVDGVLGDSTRTSLKNVVENPALQLYRGVECYAIDTSGSSLNGGTSSLSIARLNGDTMMMVIEAVFKKTILIFLLLVGVGFAKEPVAATKTTPTVLSIEKKLSLQESETIDYYNKYTFGALQCNVGSIFSDEEAKAVGFIEIPSLDIYARVQLPDIDMFQNRITHCAVADGNIFVLEQVDTQRATSMRQTLLYVCKVDKKSQKCKRVLTGSYSSYVETDKSNFTIKNGVIEIRGKSRPKDYDGEHPDKSFKVLINVF
jgi:peptidoglycan hydrolase-like protein with peptidoglycan-binding domain